MSNGDVTQHNKCNYDTQSKYNHMDAADTKCYRVAYKIKKSGDNTTTVTPPDVKYHT